MLILERKFILGLEKTSVLNEGVRPHPKSARMQWTPVRRRRATNAPSVGCCLHSLSVVWTSQVTLHFTPLHAPDSGKALHHLHSP